ncbi:MAG: ribosome maturation factor RimP [Pseudonocardia sp.]
MPSPRPEQLAGQLHGVLEPIVTDAGFELDEIDVRAAGRRHTVRLVVDSEQGVGLDDIARLSRAAAAELDVREHLIGGSYTLEVTSPGVDRPLTGSRHWRRAHLRLVAVRRHDGETFQGRVGTAGEESVTLLVDGSRRDLPYADVAHASVQVEFRPPPDAELRLLGVPAGDPASGEPA